MGCSRATQRTTAVSTRGHNALCTKKIVSDCMLINAAHLALLRNVKMVLPLAHCNMWAMRMCHLLVKVKFKLGPSRFIDWSVSFMSLSTMSNGEGGEHFNSSVSRKTSRSCVISHHDTVVFYCHNPTSHACRISNTCLCLKRPSKS